MNTQITLRGKWRPSWHGLKLVASQLTPCNYLNPGPPEHVQKFWGNKSTTNLVENNSTTGAPRKGILL